MKKLVKEVSALEKSPLRREVRDRLKEFDSFNRKNSNAWFSELCFCLLTSNSKAETAINIQNELGFDGFSKAPTGQIRTCIRKNKHR